MHPQKSQNFGQNIIFGLNIIFGRKRLFWPKMHVSAKILLEQIMSFHYLLAKIAHFSQKKCLGGITKNGEN